MPKCHICKTWGRPNRDGYCKVCLTDRLNPEGEILIKKRMCSEPMSNLSQNTGYLYLTDRRLFFFKASNYSLVWGVWGSLFDKDRYEVKFSLRPEDIHLVRVESSFVKGHRLIIETLAGGEHIFIMPKKRCLEWEELLNSVINSSRRF